MRSRLKHSRNYKYWLLLALLALSNLGGMEGFFIPPPVDCESCGASSILIFDEGFVTEEGREEKDGLVVLSEGDNEKEVEASLQGIEDPSDWSLEGSLAGEEWLESLTLAPSVGATTTISIRAPDIMPAILSSLSELPFAPLTRTSFSTQMFVVAIPSTPGLDVQKRRLRIEGTLPRVGLATVLGLEADPLGVRIVLRNTREAEFRVVVRNSAREGPWDISVERFGPLVSRVEVVPGTVSETEATFKLRVVDLENILEWEEICSADCQSSEVIALKATEGNTTITAPETVSIVVPRGFGTCPEP